MSDSDRNNKTYSTSEIAQMSGFSVRQISYWAKQGIIVPGIQRASGSGTRRRYSVDNLLQLRFVRQLLNHGWSIQKIRVAIVKLQEVMGDTGVLQRAIPIHGTKTILAICKTREGERILLDCLDPGGQQVLWIYLWALQEDTYHSTARLEESFAVNETRQNALEGLYSDIMERSQDAKP